MSEGSEIAQRSVALHGKLCRAMQEHSAHAVIEGRGITEAAGEQVLAVAMLLVSASSISRISIEEIATRAQQMAPMFNEAKAKAPK